MLFSFRAGAQDGGVFSFDPGERFSLTEKQDLRKRVNGRYEGFIYRETRGNFWSAGPGASGRYSGSIYVFQETKRNAVPVARRLDSSYSLEMEILSDGTYLLDQYLPYPALRGVPAFPAKPLRTGDTWEAPGERVVVADHRGVPTLVPILCAYRYEGIKGAGDSAYHQISCQYALRYRKASGDAGGSDGVAPGSSTPLDDPRLERVDGSHRVEIRIPVNAREKIFMRDTLDEEYRLDDGTRITYSGFILTWFDLPVKAVTPEVRTEIIQAAENWLTDHPGGEGIALEETSEGLLLTLPDVHFVPDQSRILPEEKDRLDVLAKILKTIPRGLFLVRGHTADVGTPESQQVLSEERALEIIRELKGRGLPEDRFLYEGKGGTMPLGDNATEEGRRLNRRVEIIILDQE